MSWTTQSFKPLVGCVTTKITIDGCPSPLSTFNLIYKIWMNFQYFCFVCSNLISKEDLTAQFYIKWFVVDMLHKWWFLCLAAFYTHFKNEKKNNCFFLFLLNYIAINSEYVWSRYALRLKIHKFLCDCEVFFLLIWYIWF